MDILVKNAILPFKNASTEDYEAAMLKINDTESIALQLSVCSLSKELDNVSTLGKCFKRFYLKR